MEQNAILDAVIILQAKQALQDAVMRKITQWSARLDNEARKAFYQSLNKFLDVGDRMVVAGGLVELRMLMTHLTSYRPPQTLQELIALITNVDKFSTHLVEVVEKDHPYKTEEYNLISLPFFELARNFILFLQPVMMFHDARMYERIENDWNMVAQVWKKELDEKLPLPDLGSL
jgi:hypothetical protein